MCQIAFKLGITVSDTVILYITSFLYTFSVVITSSDENLRMMHVIMEDTEGCIENTTMVS